MLLALWHFLYTVWSSDRIRIDPNEGCLRRLSRYALIQVNGEMFWVQDVRRGGEGQDAYLEYDCRNDSQRAILRVVSTPPNPDKILWRCGGEWVRCHPAQISVFSRGRSKIDSNLI